jgi:hypothetical protein
MQFLKKHYEKILLGIVLAGLIGVLVFMLFYIAADKQSMDDMANGLINPSAQALPDLDLTTNTAAVTRLQSPFALDLETGNKVYNPFEWQKTLDNQLVRKAGLTAQVVVVTNIMPLYLVLTLDQVITNTAEPRYVIGVEKQAATTVAKRRHQQHYSSKGDKNDTFVLVDVKGVAENPDALSLKLVDTGEMVTILPGKPFRRVDAYSADFRYDPEKKVFRARRKDDVVTFGGTDYQVFDISQNALILSDKSNGKKTTLPFAP